jgi:hypothetical protein
MNKDYTKSIAWIMIIITTVAIWTLIYKTINLI